MEALIIDIEDTNIETRKGKNGPYSIQLAFVHTVNRDGSAKRYPEQVNIFPQKDNDGNPVPFQKGRYYVDARSFRVTNGFLEMGFLNLTPVKAT